MFMIKILILLLLQIIIIIIKTIKIDYIATSKKCLEAALSFEKVNIEVQS